MPVKFEPPAPLKPATSDELFEAISEGDAAAVADILRRLEGLGRGELELLADLLDGDPVLANEFPYRIKLAGRGRGRPSDRLKKQATEFGIARIMGHALAKYGKPEAALEAVKKSTGLSRATITKALQADKKRSSAKTESQ